jgi:hypothetical protein
MEKLRSVPRLGCTKHLVFSTLYWTWSQGMALFVSAMTENEREWDLMRARPFLVRDLYQVDKLMEDVTPGHRIIFDYGQTSHKGRKRGSRPRRLIAEL